MKSLSGNFLAMLCTSIILVILLITKISGNNKIFQYHGISKHNNETQQYYSGIQLINNFLSGTSINNLKQGIQQLHNTITSTHNKDLLSISTGQYASGLEIQYITNTKECIELLIHGYTLIGNIKHEYVNISTGTAYLYRTLQDRVNAIPTSTSKECLQQYTKNIQLSMESLAYSYMNINTILSGYDSTIYHYRSNGGGSCAGIEDNAKKLEKLYDQIKKVKSTIALVQGKLDSRSIESYNELCLYGTIIGLTGIQEQSWSIKEGISLFNTNLTKVNNFREYIQSLIKTQVTSDVNINTSQ